VSTNGFARASVARCLVANAAVACDPELTGELRKASFELDEATTAAATLTRIIEWGPHVALLGASYPDAMGTALVRALRPHSLIPILVLGEGLSSPTCVELLDAGADDVVSMPLAPAELIARIRSRFAVIERVRGMEATRDHVLRVGVLELDPHIQEARCGGHALPLTPVEFRLLHFLMYNQGRALTRSSVLDAVWGPSTFPGSNVVDRHVFGLRRKLWPEAAHYIETVSRTGYRMRADPLHDLARTLRPIPRLIVPGAW
jgi:DNA-binding response OmpR family regulator